MGFLQMARMLYTDARLQKVQKTFRVVHIRDLNPPPWGVVIGGFPKIL